VQDAAGRAAGEARIEAYRAEHGHTYWVVERKDDGALLGFCGLKRSNQAGGPIGMMEVGWRLREDAWGRGYAKEAATAALGLAFGRFAADEVIALTASGNAASWGLMIRLGMARREDLDFDSPDFDPENPRIIAYGITCDQWKNQQ
jgi:RimJ/RimL family protein N-acetyltransferase